MEIYEYIDNAIERLAALVKVEFDEIGEKFKKVDEKFEALDRKSKGLEDRLLFKMDMLEQKMADNLEASIEKFALIVKGGLDEKADRADVAALELRVGSLEAGS